MASLTDTQTTNLTFASGLPRVVRDYTVEDDIMYVMHGGVKMIVWSDHRIHVSTRYDTHSCYHEWREKEYIGDPRPPRVREYWDYHQTADEAMDSALAEQERILRQTGEEVPIYFREG